MNNRSTEERLNNTPGSKTHSFTQNQLASKTLIYISFSDWINEEAKNISWPNDVVAPLTFDLKTIYAFNLSTALVSIE